MPEKDAEKFIKAIRKVEGANGPRQVFDAFASSFAFLLAAGSGNDCKWLGDRAESALAALAGDAAGKVPGLYMEAAGFLEGNPDQDLLGVAYTKLGLGDARRGQYFTPYNVCKMMAKMTMGDRGCLEAEIEEKGFITVGDPTAGCGAMLVAAANHLLEEGVNYQAHAFFDAQDIDELTAITCYVQMSLLGMAGRVAIGNSLTGDVRHELHTPMMALSDAWALRAFIGRV